MKSLLMLLLLLQYHHMPPRIPSTSQQMSVSKMAYFVSSGIR